MATRGRENVAFLPALEDGGGGAGSGFLAEQAERAADDLGLAVEGDQPLLQRARGPEEAVHLEQLVAAQARRNRRGRGGRSMARHDVVNCSGRESWPGGAWESRRREEWRPQSSM